MTTLRKASSGTNGFMVMISTLRKVLGPIQPRYVEGRDRCSAGDIMRRARRFGQLPKQRLKPRSFLIFEPMSGSIRCQESCQKQNGPRDKARGPPGGLLGIDQEVVTLTWPLRRTPGSRARPRRRAESILIHRSSCRSLRATALSLSHLTWSCTATTMTIRICHRTTSFPVYLHLSTKGAVRSTGTKVESAGCLSWFAARSRCST